MKCKIDVICVILCMDDNLLVGLPSVIKHIIGKLQESGFTLKACNGLTDCLFCEARFNKQHKFGWLGQPHMIQKLESELGKETPSGQNCKTPGSPQFLLVLCKDDTNKLVPAKHKRCRLGVGMLLWLVKHSKPNIANAVRALSKVVSAPNQAACKEMFRIVKYVLD